MLLKLFKTIVPRKNRLSIRINITRVKGCFLRGKNFGCNVCGKDFRKMVTHGNIPRKNAKCPNCQSLERTRVLWFYLKDRVLDENKPLNVLHFAPEYGLKKALQKYKNLHYKNVDIDPDMADEVVDICHIPYPDCSFDLILCSHVLGHVPEEKKAIEELYRVLNQAGQALVMTIIDWNKEQTFENSSAQTAQEKFENYSEPDLVRLHGRDFADRLRNGGFYVEQIDYALELSDHIRTHYNLGDGNREIIFKCSKPNQ